MPKKNDNRATILDEYKDKKDLYASFASTISSLISGLISSGGIQLHSITNRCKSIDSLTSKIYRPDKSYSKLTDITDLAGVRITTYFADDVDQAASFLEEHFEIDKLASIDKRKFSDPARFGYRSLHYIVQLGSDRCNLPEYRCFSGLKCEVQVRSILQHAWAEIEHDLGYKSSAAVPNELRRKFARIASLLELADDEFSALRIALSNYEESLPEKIANSPDMVGLDFPSFKALYSTSSNVAALDDVVVSSTDGVLTDQIIKYPERLLERAQYFGLTTIGDIEHRAMVEKETVREFSKYWMNKKRLGKVSRGVGLFYLCYVLAWRTQNAEYILEYLNKGGIGDDNERETLVDRIMSFSYSK